MPDTLALPFNDKRTEEFLSRAQDRVELAKNNEIAFADQLQGAVNFLRNYSKSQSPLTFEVLDTAFNLNCDGPARHWLDTFKEDLNYCAQLPDYLEHPELFPIS